MQRTQHSTAAAGNTYTPGNPSQGVPATVVTADAMNEIQEELARTVLAAGIALTAGDYTQLEQAIRHFAGLRLGLKNQAINGDMRVWQRGPSVAVGDAAAYTADRWAAQADGPAGAGVATVSRQAFAPGQTDIPGNPTYFLRHNQTVAAANGSPILYQRIEDVRTLQGQEITVSFAAMADSPYSVNVVLTQHFGDGGSADLAAGTVTVNVGDSWGVHKATVTVPDVTGRTIGEGSYLEVRFVMPIAESFVIDIGQVQVERGGAATGFDLRPMALELALCQRYFEKSYPIDVVPGTYSPQGPTRGFDVGTICDGLVTRFRAEKRATPTMQWWSSIENTADLGNSLANAVFWAGADRLLLQTVSPSTADTGAPEVVAAASVSTPSNCSAHWTADAEL